MDLSQTLKLPEDVVNHLPIINITGNRIILIENFKSIVDYQEDHIRIKTRKMFLTILGSKLSVEYYNQEEIKILGKINKIEFEVFHE
ncbi:MAG: YabP/YqfC family sporulation protein [Lachnospiraceae bacterium]